MDIDYVKDVLCKNRFILKAVPELPAKLSNYKLNPLKIYLNKYIFFI